MEKNIVKQSILGLIKTISGNVKPINDNLSLAISLSFTQKEMFQLMYLIGLNFMLDLDANKFSSTMSLNQLVDIVIWEVLNSQQNEVA